MFAPSIRGRVGVNGRRACPHQCQVAHHSPLADYQSPPQRERPRPSASPLQRLNPSTLQRFDGFTLLKQRERASAFTLLELLIVVGIVAVLLVLIAPAFTSIKGGGDVTNAAYTIKGVLDTART